MSIRTAFPPRSLGFPCYQPQPGNRQLCSSSRCVGHSANTVSLESLVLPPLTQDDFLQGPRRGAAYVVRKPRWSEPPVKTVFSSIQRMALMIFLRCISQGIWSNGPSSMFSSVRSQWGCFCCGVWSFLRSQVHWGIHKMAFLDNFGAIDVSILFLIEYDAA